jgi:hypothetical protein
MIHRQGPLNCSMSDDAKIRAIIADECELEEMADRIIAALAFHNYRIVPTPLEDWRRTQFKPLPVPPGYEPKHQWAVDCAACGLRLDSGTTLRFPKMTCPTCGPTMPARSTDDCYYARLYGVHANDERTCCTGPSVLDGCCEDHCTHPDDDGWYADEHCTAHCPLAASTCSPSSEPDSSTGSNDPSPVQP